MTSEVAVINASAVALAADSAVTIGQQKIYNSALKLFSLSKVHPVGVMIYGNAQLLKTPWETMIKVYRQELGGRSFDTLEEYAHDFVDYLSNHAAFFSEDDQRDWFLTTVYICIKMIKNNLVEHVRDLIDSNGKVTAKETSAILKSVVDEMHEDFGSRSRLESVPNGFEENLISKHKKGIESIRKDVLGNVNCSATTLSKISDIIIFANTRDIFSNAASGLVIAGYGSHDIFPSVITHEIDGIIDGYLKCKKLEGKSCTGERNGGVIAFAQDDMVAAFMNGANPSINDFLYEYLNRMFEQLPAVMQKSLKLESSKTNEKLVNEFKSDSTDLLNKFFDDLRDHTIKKHVQPVMQMVQALPKDELAAMAESLVNLTAFKRRMTGTLETVGGPIDVAVISKGDGLAWVKRKHYFPRELNQHFFANYFRGV